MAQTVVPATMVSRLSLLWYLSTKLLCAFSNAGTTQESWTPSIHQNFIASLIWNTKTN